MIYLLNQFKIIVNFKFWGKYKMNKVSERSQKYLRK